MIEADLKYWKGNPKMTRMWKQNEQKDEEEELVVTDHRDQPDRVNMPEDVQTVEYVEDDVREALEDLGEDVESSPARRGEAE